VLDLIGDLALAENRFLATSLLTAPDMHAHGFGVAAVAGPDAMEETSLEENHDALPSSSP